MGSPRSKYILLAEDDPSIAEVVSFVLKEAKYKVITPKSYKGILTLLDKQTFDLILLDLVLWGDSGSDLCLKIKSNPNTKKIPIIILSARSEVSHIARLTGADDMIKKPFAIDELLKKVKQYVG